LPFFPPLIPKPRFYVHSPPPALSVTREPLFSPSFLSEFLLFLYCLPSSPPLSQCLLFGYYSVLFPFWFPPFLGFLFLTSGLNPFFPFLACSPHFFSSPFFFLLFCITTLGLFFPPIFLFQEFAMGSEPLHSFFLSAIRLCFFSLPFILAPSPLNSQRWSLLLSGDFSKCQLIFDTLRSLFVPCYFREIVIFHITRSLTIPTLDRSSSHPRLGQLISSPNPMTTFRPSHFKFPSYHFSRSLHHYSSFQEVDLDPPLPPFFLPSPPSKVLVHTPPMKPRLEVSFFSIVLLPLVLISSLFLKSLAGTIALHPFSLTLIPETTLPRNIPRFLPRNNLFLTFTSEDKLRYNCGPLTPKSFPIFLL